MSPTKPTAKVADADAYFRRRGNADDWFDEIELKRDAALERASDILGACYDFHADAFVECDVARRWRDEILYALFEEALWLLRVDPTKVERLKALGVTRASLGVLSATFAPENARGYLCELAAILVGDYATRKNVPGLGAVSSTPLAP